MLRNCHSQDRQLALLRTLFHCRRGGLIAGWLLYIMCVGFFFMYIPLYFEGTNKINFKKLKYKMSFKYSLKLLTLLCKTTITKVTEWEGLKVWTYIITSITACPIRLSAILVIMSGLTFKSDIILYIFINLNPLTLSPL
jgi:hypothetical protein